MKFYCMQLKKVTETIEVIAFTIFRSSGPFTEIKLIPASLATALASSVLPQPGGPQSNTPEEAEIPNSANCSGYLTGALNQNKTTTYL
jgi:hypothetical protein